MTRDLVKNSRNGRKLFLLGILLIPCWVIAARFDIDLVNLYAAAKFAATDLTRVYAQNGDLGRYFYGPFSVVLIEPLSGFSYETVKWLWIILQTIGYGTFWWMLGKIYPWLKSPLIFWGWMLVWIFSINPIHNNFQSNNIQLMLAAVLVVSEVLTRQRSLIAGFVAGFLCFAVGAVKVFPLFIVVYYWLVKGRSVRAGILAGVVVTGLVPFLVYGQDGGLILYRDFFSNLTTYDSQNSPLQVYDLISLPTLVTRWMASATSLSISTIDRICKLMVLLVSGVFFTGAYLKKRRGQFRDSEAETQCWAMAWALMAFLNPSTRPHYLIFYVPAVCSLLGSAYHSSRRVIPVVGVLVSLALLCFTTDAILGKSLNDQLERWNVQIFGTIVLMLSLWVSTLGNVQSLTIDRQLN